MSTLTSSLIISLIDRLTAPARGINAAVEGITNAVRRNAAQMDAARGKMLDAVGAGYALARGLAAPINAAIEFESSMADIKKVIDFDTPDGFANLGKDIRKMATTDIPMAADGIAAIVAAAGQSGIAVNELTGFADMAAKVSVAWETSAGETGEALAKLKTALGLSIPETGLLADAINHLGNNTAASAPDILAFTRRVAPMAKQFGLTTQQAAAMGSAMIGSGFEAEVAATSFLNMGRALTKGSSASKRQQVAMKAIGVDSRKVAKSMQKDAVGTIKTVLAQINKLPDYRRASIISDIFGDEARALGPMINDADLLAKVLGLVGDQSEYAGSAQAEFEERSKTTANAIQMLKNRIHDVAISIGDALLPGINLFIKAVSPLVTSLSDLAQRFPEVTAAIVAITAGVVGFRVAVTAASWAALFMKGSLLQMGLGAAVATRGIIGLLNPIRLVTAAFKVMRLVLLSTGIGAIAIGIAAAGTWIYNNWKGISRMFTAFGSAFSQAMRPVMPLLQPVIDGAKKLYDWTRNLLGPVDGLGQSWFRMGRNAGSAIGQATATAVQWLANLPAMMAGTDWSGLGLSLADSFRSIDWSNVGANVLAGISSAMAGASDGVRQIQASIVSAIGTIDWGSAGASAGNAVAGLYDAIASGVSSLNWGGIGEFIGNAIGTAIAGLLDIGSALLQSWYGGGGEAGLAAAIAASLAAAITGVDWSALGRSILNALLSIKQAINDLFVGIFRGLDISGEGARLMDSLMEGIKEGMAAISEYIRSSFASAFAYARSAARSVLSTVTFGMMGGDDGPQVDGARARGGPVRAGGTYLVGEEGPELFSPGRSGMISPNDVYNEMSRGGSTSAQPMRGGTGDVTIQINVPGVVVRSETDIENLVRELTRRIRDEMRGLQGDTNYMMGF